MVGSGRVPVRRPDLRRWGCSPQGGGRRVCQERGVWLGTTGIPGSRNSVCEGMATRPQGQTRQSSEPWQGPRMGSRKHPVGADLTVLDNRIWGLGERGAWTGHLWRQGAEEEPIRRRQKPRSPLEMPSLWCPGRPGRDNGVRRETWAGGEERCDVVGVGHAAECGGARAWSWLFLTGTGTCVRSPSFAALCSPWMTPTGVCALLSAWNHVGTQRGSVILMTERACEQTSEGHRAQRCTMRFEDRERDARCEMQRAKQRTGVHSVSAQ